ncbi:hypothetical protein PIB30_070854 [Stylosanthes scabra]|uniref:WRKY domain-containing protein n=1 Tax=Stylosanthes scabra TaxID=79078 RepID=A0ABU6TNC6_9FABA|nr:hypothetical protein [Stylosanthes scabra]
MVNHHHYSSKERREIMEQELLRGRDVANQLLQVLVHRSNNKNNDDEQGLMLILPFAEDLVHQVLRSFTNTLLLLNSSNNNNNHNNSNIDGAIFPITMRDLSSSSSSPSRSQKHEDLDEACKSFHTKNRRGRYKRKSTEPTWERDNPILFEDGHAWRKYGQKKTINSKFLRSYYRCSHKYDEGCPAMKHVQRIRENPPLYRTTYYGHHTCKNTLYNNEESIIILEHESKSSMFLSFNNNNNNNKSIIPAARSKEQQFSTPTFRSTKQEPVETVIQDDHQSQLLYDDHHEVDFAKLSSSPSPSPSCIDDNTTTVHKFDDNSYYDCGWDLDYFDGLPCFGDQDQFLIMQEV